MTPVLMQQFRLFYDQSKPIGVVLWARVSAEVEAMLAAGTTKLRPQDWRSGDRLWVVEVIAPFGGAEEMVRDLKAKVFPDREIKYVALGAGGKMEVRVA
jgi:cytolysin-activating lysine-acyltransferase